jgi:hypothetical protein
MQPAPGLFNLERPGFSFPKFLSATIIDCSAPFHHLLNSTLHHLVTHDLDSGLWLAL